MVGAASFRQASTDGKIVGLCPGCDKALRKHTTPHGDELRHLHNDSVRCHGNKTAGLEEAEEAAAGATPVGRAAEVANDVGEGVGETFHQFTNPGNDWAQRANGFQSSLHTADYLGRPDAQNPTGMGPDDFRAKTWNAYETTRPMQTMEDRDMNTPVVPEAPIKTRQINSPNPGHVLRNDRLEEDDDNDEDEDEE